MATECEADIQVKVATAKLSVAEALRVPMSCLAGLLAHAYTDSWLIYRELHRSPMDRSLLVWQGI